MAPSYRISTQTRRGARNAYPEHDDFEGLPVRQWRHEWISVEPPQAALTSESKTNNRWAYELPWGMPKDWQLLPPHTQDLLRAARSGILYKRRAPTEEDEVDADGTVANAAANAAIVSVVDAASDGTTNGDAVAGVNGDAATAGLPPTAATVSATKKKPGAGSPAKESVFTMRVWKQLPRDVEAPLTSHLAKRRKNTVVLPPKQTIVAESSNSASSMPMPMVTVARVRRLDAAGNAYEQAVTLTDGQKVDGEILSTTLVPASNRDLPPPPQQLATPSRKRNPPPRRKGKIGRGRKKGVLPIGLQRSRQQHAAAAAAAAAAEAAATTSTTATTEGGDGSAGGSEAPSELPSELPPGSEVKKEEEDDDEIHDESMADFQEESSAEPKEAELSPAPVPTQQAAPEQPDQPKEVEQPDVPMVDQPPLPEVSEQPAEEDMTTAEAAAPALDEEPKPAPVTEEPAPASGPVPAPEPPAEAPTPEPAAPAPEAAAAAEPLPEPTAESTPVPIMVEETKAEPLPVVAADAEPQEEVKEAPQEAEQTEQAVPTAADAMAATEVSAEEVKPAGDEQ